MDCARLHGWFAYHTFDSRRSEPGFPDCVFVRGERLIFVELKAAGRKPTAAQEDWLAALRAACGTVYVWTPADWISGRIEAVLR